MWTKKSSNTFNKLNKFVASNELKSKSGWVPLLLTLMYEYTKEHSKWRPYFDMVPDIQFDIPMFWDELVIEYLFVMLIELLS